MKCDGDRSEWKNANVLFCHSIIDDAKIPKAAMRILLHLQRRVGKRSKRNANINPGIKSMAKTCKLKKDSIEAGLRWLKARGYIEIAKTGRSNHYKVLVSQKKLYIDHRLDEYGLSAVQMRVLAHMSRLCGDRSGLVENFFVDEKKFAKVCGIDERTIGKTIRDLEEMEFCLPYIDKKNPPWGLMLFDLFPRRERKSKTIEEAR